MNAHAPITQTQLNKLLDRATNTKPPLPANARCSNCNSNEWGRCVGPEAEYSAKPIMVDAFGSCGDWKPDVDYVEEDE